MRWPWQTKEDPVIDAIDRAIEDAELARREHEEALRQLRARLPKEVDE